MGNKSSAGTAPAIASATNRSSTTEAAQPSPPARPTLTRTIAEWMQVGHMSHLGISNTMRLAHTFNRIRFRRQDQWRRALYPASLAALLEENGPLTRPAVDLKDGYAIDTSMSLPHLDRILEDSEKIIAERSGARHSDDRYRSYFHNVWKAEDYTNYPAFLDFATSSDVLSAVAHYLKCIPALSTTLPPGIRFVESNAAFDDQPEVAKDSQLYHIDYYSLPNFYVIVLLRDTTSENGPFVFLPRSVSQKTAKELAYWSRRKSYRLSDQEIYSKVDPKDAIEFSYPRGTVLYIESSGCFHYGSRNSVKPRFQLMLGYTGACRTDFSELILPPKVYPIRPTDSRLRKMVLDKNMREPVS